MNLNKLRGLVANLDNKALDMFAYLVDTELKERQEDIWGDYINREVPLMRGEEL